MIYGSTGSDFLQQLPFITKQLFKKMILSTICSLKGNKKPGTVI